MFSDINKVIEMKRKVRKLKKMETRIRFNNETPPFKTFIWDQFFNLNPKTNNKAKYSLDDLILLNKEEYKAIINEYFSYVYYELYKEKGIIFIQGVYDPSILSKLNLPLDAGEYDIKKRFRELANIYHPDKGGDANKFIELMDHYKKLMGKS